jgi:L-iditol 2-dehydrogenase
MSFSHAALVEPISVSYASLLRSSLQLATPTLILGAGPIGLSAISLARAAGAYPIIVTDIAEHRLEWATKCGADQVVKVEIGWKGEEVAKAIGEVFDKWNIRPRVALECTGAVDSVFGAVYGECMALVYGGNMYNKLN